MCYTSPLVCHISATIERSMVKLTPSKMGRAHEMRKRGMSYRSIGKELQVSYETVRVRLEAAAVRGDLYPRSPPGKPEMEVRMVRRIHRDLLFHPFRTWRQIAKANGIGPKAVAKVAHSHFLFRFVSKKKPFLTKKARQARMWWLWDAARADWLAMIFTDECMVKIGGRGRRQAHPTISVHPSQVPQVCHPPKRVWGRSQIHHTNSTSG